MHCDSSGCEVAIGYCLAGELTLCPADRNVQLVFDEPRGDRIVAICEADGRVLFGFKRLSRRLHCKLRMKPPAGYIKTTYVFSRAIDLWTDLWRLPEYAAQYNSLHFLRRWFGNTTKGRHGDQIDTR